MLFHTANLQSMLNQGKPQQQQPQGNEPQADQAGSFLGDGRVDGGETLTQAIENLVNGEAQADQAQAGTEPSVEGALGGRPVALPG